ncbi:MAG: 30S ribosomal protein S12 methylthiotransferase RimO [Lentisphaerae bacterium]|nr:30S ribosomal protein S12 methylthiotransferase RimO [Lentisphaerota bacterium]
MGCAKNLVDSQIMAGELIANNITLAATPENADVVIVNTCAFIEDARKESIDAIFDACALKAKGRCRAVIVAGCMIQRYRDELKQEMPEVDAFIGLDNLLEIADVVRKVYEGHSVYRVSPKAKRLFEPRKDSVVFSGGAYAYVKIAEGCNHKCSFCAIPAIRGAYRSRLPDDIVREAEDLLSRGFKELDIISQDITSYGKDLGGKITLASLLRRIGNIGGDFWIRLLYGYPSNVTDELLAAMAETKQVCHYLDLPIQHSHPNILRTMRRADTIKHMPQLIDTIRSQLPDVILRTTCLVGFPGENREHFQHLLEFIKNTEFDHLGAFVFSPEEKTPAIAIKAKTDKKTAEKRREELLAAQAEIVANKQKKLVGQQDKVLLDRILFEGKTCAGRSYRLAPEADGEIIVEGAGQEDIGKFKTVKYTAQSDYDMKAICI